MKTHLAITGIFLLFANSAMAFDDKIEWNVNPDFHNHKAALEISGAICPGSKQKLEFCYAVNDEKKYFQAFSITQRTIEPKERQRVLPKKSSENFEEPDLEAIAYDNGYIYLTGSHGLPRRNDDDPKSRYFTYRMKVDDETGAPVQPLSLDNKVEAVQRTAKLKVILESHPNLSMCRNNENKLNKKCNIEGLAVIDGHLFYGFRAPTDGDGAMVLKVPVDQMFGSDALVVELYRPNLGHRYGIRDMAVLENEILILAGAADSEELPPIVWKWRPGEPPNLLRVLDTDKGAKAEALLLLNVEDHIEEDEDLRGLVMFDGQKNGAPTEYVLIEE